MNEQNHIDQSNVDQETQDLINGGIDGELSTTEQHELEQMLAGSEDARNFNEEQRAFAGLLDELPQREPPGYLKSAIERQVRLPVATSDSEVKRGFLGSWLPAYWLRTGFAFAAGLVLTVGIYEIGSENISSEDAASMVGTVVQNPLAGKSTLLDSIDIKTATLNGRVELRDKDGLWILDVKLNSQDPAHMKVDISDLGLEFEGVMRMQNYTEAVSVEDGFINVASSGEQHYALMLRRTSIDQGQISEPLELGFFTNDTLVLEAELGGSR
jgi:hypothetical protein